MANYDGDVTKRVCNVTNCERDVTRRNCDVTRRDRCMDVAGRTVHDWTVTWSHFEAQQEWYLYCCHLPRDID